MASVKYSKLPMADSEDSLRFDYSSAFTFEERSDIDNASSAGKYRSAFTYERDDKYERANDLIESSGKESSSQLSTDKLARLMVTLGFSIIFILAFPIMVWFSFKKVPNNERLVVFRLGRLHKSKGPGLVFLFPLIDRCHKIDVRLKAFSVPPKQIITEDGAIIEVGADIYFQIVDAEKSVTNVQNLDQSTRILLQTALCNILVQKPLAEIEAERRTIAETVMAKSNTTCVNWGVEITRAELSHIKVLSGPQEKKTPTVMMPPGMFGNMGMPGATDQSAMPTAFSQLAAAFTTPQGPGQTKAIAEALHSFVAPRLAAKGLTPVEHPSPLTPNTNDLSTFLQSGDQRRGESQQLVNLMECNTEQVATPVQPLPPLPPSNPLLPNLRPEDVILMIRGALSQDVVQKVGETYQFEIKGKGEGSYYLDLKNGSGVINEGPDPSGDPSATLTLTFDDLQAMLQGQLKPFQAYMSGRLKVSGDTSAALKLEELGNEIQSLAKSGLQNIYL